VKGGVDNVKRFLIGSLAIVLVLGMTGGAFAFFSDTETSSGNTFTAGTLDLKIKDGSMFWSDGISTAEWHLSNMKPGDTYPEHSSMYGSIDFKNTGSIYADHIEITCSYTIVDPPGPESDIDGTSADAMAGEMIITTMDYVFNATVVDCLPLITDANGNGYKDLYDLQAGGVDDLPLMQSGVQQARLDMILQFNPLAGNDYQGDTLNLTMIFTLNQHSSQ
jgi:predicted ribosomally synthesized peptide with SipW-like signal peptide